MLRLTPKNKSIFDVNKLSLSFVYPDLDKLSVDDLGRNYFVDRNILGHITGACSRSDSVVEQGCSSDETNNEIRDKTRQALIAEQLVDACRSLILVRNGLALLDKLNGNVNFDMISCNDEKNCLKNSSIP